MWWMIFPISAAIFYCIGNYAQNYIADNVMPKRHAGAYAVMRIPGFILAMVLLYALFHRAVFMLPLYNAVGLMIAGAVNVIGAVYYYKALQSGDTADISIFGQVTPIISLALGVIILGEMITSNQAIGFGFIMAATIYIALTGNRRAKKSKRSKGSYIVIVMTLISCFFSVFSDILYANFLIGTMDYTLLAQSFFYFELGSLVFTILGYIFFDSWREATKKAFLDGRGHRKHLAYAIGENIVFLVAEVLYKLGLLLAPVKSLMSVVGRVASLFTSLFITIFFGRVFPKFISAKRPSRKMIARYLIAAVVIVVGMVIMNT